MTKKRSFSSFQRAESTAERFCGFLIMKKGVLLLSLRRKDGRFPALTDCGFCDCIKRCFLHNSGGTVGFLLTPIRCEGASFFILQINNKIKTI